MPYVIKVPAEYHTGMYFARVSEYGFWGLMANIEHATTWEHEYVARAALEAAPRGVKLPGSIVEFVA